MTLSQVTAEAIADGTAITSTNAAASGFALVSLGGGTITAKSAAALDGARGFEIVSVAGATTLGRISLSSANQKASISVAFKLVTVPTGATNIQTIGIRYASGYVMRLNWDSATTKIRLNDAVASAIGADYNSAALATAYRLEIVANTGASTTAGSGTANLYLLAGTSPIASWSMSGNNLHGPDAITGIDIQASNGAAIYYDSIQSNDGGTTEIGRIAVPVNSAPTVSITSSSIYQVAGSNVALSGTVTDSDGTVSSAQWQYMDDDENGAFTGSWTNITTTLTGSGTASATATATDSGVPAGVRRYRLSGTDNSGSTSTATTDAHIYAASATNVTVRYVINTGAYVNAGTTPAPSILAAMNDTSPSTGYESWAESPAAPSNALLTLVFEPVGPGPITLIVDLQLDASSPAIDVSAVVKNVSGATTVFDGGVLTPTTTAAHYTLTLDTAGNTAATQSIRGELRLDLSATQV